MARNPKHYTNAHMDGIKPSAYKGEIGFLRVEPTIPGEAPIWCPVRVIQARICFQRVDFSVEPVGGFGTMKASTKTVWFNDPVLNKMTEKPMEF